MKLKNGDFPLDIYISFNKLFERYRKNLDSGNRIARLRAEEILKIADTFPVLSEGIKDEAGLSEYKEQIDLVLEEIFSSVLTENEIKIATTPYNDVIFKSTDRFDKIIGEAGKDFILEITNFDESHFYILGCSIILSSFYGYDINFKRPFYYNIPDANGIVRNYRVLFNADFVEIEKTEASIDITQEDINELLESFDDIDFWKKKFPPGSWKFKGFIISNMYDATLDVSLSDFKANLLRRESHGGTLNKDFERIFKKIFGLNDLRIGFSDYNEEEEIFEKLMYKDVESYILSDIKKQDCKDALCDVSHYTLFKKQQFYCVSDTKKYNELYPDNILYKKLLGQGIRSCILASIVSDGQMLGILELVSPNPNDLNTVNASKLLDVLPYLQDSVARARARLENDLELIVQEECTSIHGSVHWKFKKEAKRYLNGISQGNPSFFREIVFEDVYPLFGQMDIKGSSAARNIATKQDLALQLEHIQVIVKKIIAIEPLPIYSQISFKINNFVKDFDERLQVDTERNIFNFLSSEINPLFKHLRNKNGAFQILVEEYDALVDSETGLIYKHRKDYDDSVMLINKRMAGILDRKQQDAQMMHPHYYERFKTDGVEHNMYIGESITKLKTFNSVYLHNLRLWQLQVMCEMENSFYKLKDSLPLPLDVASMLLVYNNSLSLRFRMDEKRFDVDGTYNARYEVVKKRVDKAHIKNTEERVTQAGKLTIIYSQKEDEIEYLKYIEFLQEQKQLNDDVEILELEDLQGVTGLKALRVGIYYNLKSNNETNKDYYTYEDLITQLNN